MLDKIVRRGGDSEGDNYIEIRLSHDGDVYVCVKGKNPKGEIAEAQIEFCARFGGGYHPQTITALTYLAEAIDKDNTDIESPRRYHRTVC